MVMAGCLPWEENPHPEVIFLSHLPLPRLALLAAALLTALAMGCNGGDGGVTGDPVRTPAGLGGQDPSDELELAAQDNLYSTVKLVAPSSTEVKVTLHNEDEGVRHGFSLYRSRDANERIFVGEAFEGPGSREYRLETPGPGSYLFRCDVHPDRMTGSFVVR
jgi:hypothetical protein